MATYVGGLLIDFVHVENLYRIRNCRGKRLEEVGEMLIECVYIDGAASPDTWVDHHATLAAEFGLSVRNVHAAPFKIIEPRGAAGNPRS